jgi:hypothetical protein
MRQALGIGSGFLLGNRRKKSVLVSVAVAAAQRWLPEGKSGAVRAWACSLACITVLHRESIRGLVLERRRT